MSVHPRSLLMPLIGGRSSEADAVSSCFWPMVVREAAKCNVGNSSFFFSPRKMSKITASNCYAPVPNTSRGNFTHLKANKQGTKLLYTSGPNVLIRYGEGRGALLSGACDVARLTEGIRSRAVTWTTRC